MHTIYVIFIIHILHVMSNICVHTNVYTHVHVFPPSVQVDEKIEIKKKNWWT